MDKSSFLLFLITTVWISQAIACDSDCLLRCFVKCSVPDEGESVFKNVLLIVVK